MIKHEEVLPHRKHDSHPILAGYGLDRFSIRINDKDKDIKSVTPFQTKFKTPIEKNNNSLHQQSLLLDDTDITSDDEGYLYSRVPKQNSTFTTDTTLQDTTLKEETFSAITKPRSTGSQQLTSAIDVQTNSQPATQCSQILPFYDTSFFKYKYCFQGFFLLDDYALDLKTLQQQQQLPQDPVRKTVYYWLTRN